MSVGVLEPSRTGASESRFVAGWRQGWLESSGVLIRREVVVRQSESVVGHSGVSQETVQTVESVHSQLTSEIMHWETGNSTGTGTPQSLTRLSSHEQSQSQY